MRIVFLGSSHGVPEANRKCSSIMLEVGCRRYIIDMGTQAIEQLITRRIPIESVKAVFVTHMHGDHTNGLISFADLCSWYFKKATPEIYLPGSVENAVSAIAAWIGCNGVKLSDNIKFSPVSEGAFYDDGIIKVTAFRTKHTDNSYAYLVEAEGKRVLFSGDLSHRGPQDDFPMSVLDALLDLAICEGAHFSATAYIPLFQDCDNLRQLCINHYSNVTLRSVMQLIKEMPGTFRAEDGTEIVL